MPAGAHYGGHGGYSGGLHSSFSSHSGSRSSGSGYNASFHMRPFMMPWFGRTVYISTGHSGAMVGFGILMVLTIVIAVFTGVMCGSISSDINQREKDYDMYQAMIQEAYEDPDLYTVEAKVTQYWRYDGTDRYMIEFEFDVHDSTEPNLGGSYYVYSYHEVAEYMKARKVLIAVNTPNTELGRWSTDAIPVDYQDKALVDDAEYAEWKSELPVMRIICIGASVLAVVALIALIIVPFTAKKATAEQIAQNKTSTGTEKTVPSNTWRCGYCGSLNPEKNTTCDACGAKRH